MIETHGDTDSFRIDARGGYQYAVEVRPQDRGFYTCIRGVYREDSQGNLTRIRDSGHCDGERFPVGSNHKIFGNDDPDDNSDFVVVVGANGGTGRYRITASEQLSPNLPPSDDFWDDL